MRTIANELGIFHMNVLNNKNQFLILSKEVSSSPVIEGLQRFLPPFPYPVAYTLNYSGKTGTLLKQNQFIDLVPLLVCLF